MRYYAAHGAGLVSQHSVLTWTGTKLQAQDVLKGEPVSHRALPLALQSVDPGLAVGTACHPPHSFPPSSLRLPAGAAGAHELAALEEVGRVGAAHPAAQVLVAALSEFLAQDLAAAPAASPPHVAVCGASAADCGLFASWALQRIGGQVAPALQPAAAGLRTVVLPSSQLSTLPELAWSLSQHPRMRFVVVAPDGMDAPRNISTGDLAALLSGRCCGGST